MREMTKALQFFILTYCSEAHVHGLHTVTRTVVELSHSRFLDESLVSGLWAGRQALSVGEFAALPLCAALPRRGGGGGGCEK